MKLPKFFNRKAKPANIQRGFDAARVSRLNDDWITGPLSADAELYGSIGKIRNRARDLERNETYVEKFLFELENNIIGNAGIRLRSEPRQPDGGIDKLAKEAIEWAWYHQNKSANYNVNKRIGGTDTERMILRTVARDGECLVRIVRSYDNQFKFAVHLMESDQLDDIFFGTAKNGNEIRMGIEIDKWNVPQAYWITQTHPGDNFVSMRHNGRVRIRVPADDLIHVYRCNRPGQTRGYSWLVTAMQALKMLGGYEEAELVAARVAAAKGGFFTSKSGEDYAPVDPNNPDAPMSMELEPGTFEQLPTNMDFTPYNPTHPTSQFEGFRKAILRRIASGLTMSYNTLASDLEGVNFSSLRDGKLTERDGYKCLQNWFIDTYRRPLFLKWLRFTLDMGLLKMNNGQGSPLPAAKFEKFAEHSFIPRRWDWVDPLKDGKQAEILRNNGWKSDSQIVAEMGGEYTETILQIKGDEEYAAEQGVEKQVDKDARIQQMDTNGINE